MKLLWNPTKQTKILLTRPYRWSYWKIFWRYIARFCNQQKLICKHPALLFPGGQYPVRSFPASFVQGQSVSHKHKHKHRPPQSFDIHQSAILFFIDWDISSFTPKMFSTPWQNRKREREDGDDYGTSGFSEHRTVSSPHPTPPIYASYIFKNWQLSPETTHSSSPPPHLAQPQKTEYHTNLLVLVHLILLHTTTSPNHHACRFRLWR